MRWPTPMLIAFAMLLVAVSRAEASVYDHSSPQALLESIVSSEPIDPYRERHPALHPFANASNPDVPADTVSYEILENALSGDWAMMFVEFEIENWRRERVLVFAAIGDLWYLVPMHWDQPSYPTKPVPPAWIWETRSAWLAARFLADPAVIELTPGEPLDMRGVEGRVRFRFRGLDGAIARIDVVRADGEYAWADLKHPDGTTLLEASRRPRSVRIETEVTAVDYRLEVGIYFDDPVDFTVTLQLCSGDTVPDGSIRWADASEPASITLAPTDVRSMYVDLPPGEWIVFATSPTATNATLRFSLWRGFDKLAYDDNQRLTVTLQTSGRYRLALSRLTIHRRERTTGPRVDDEIPIKFVFRAISPDEIVVRPIEIGKLTKPVVVYTGDPLHYEFEITEAGRYSLTVDDEHSFLNTYRTTVRILRDGKDVFWGHDSRMALVPGRYRVIVEREWHSSSTITILLRPIRVLQPIETDTASRRFPMDRMLTLAEDSRLFIIAETIWGTHAVVHLTRETCVGSYATDAIGHGINLPAGTYLVRLLVESAEELVALTVSYETEPGFEPAIPRGQTAISLGGDALELPAQREPRTLYVKVPERGLVEFECAIAEEDFGPVEIELFEGDVPIVSISESLTYYLVLHLDAGVYRLVLRFGEYAKRCTIRASSLDRLALDTPRTVHMLVTPTEPLIVPITVADPYRDTIHASARGRYSFGIQPILEREIDGVFVPISEPPRFGLGAVLDHDLEPGQYRVVATAPHGWACCMYVSLH